MEKLITHPTNQAQEKALKAVCEALQIPYENQQETEEYNPEFVAKIKRSIKQAEEGKVTSIATTDLWK